MSGVSNRKFLYFKLYINNLSNRFSSDSLVYNSIDDIPKSGSCFGTISKSIKIGTVTIPAYSRFSFINTGTSTDGALFAIDSNGYSYTAYRTSGVWNKCFATVTKDDLYPSYAQGTLFSDVKADVTDKSITITENGMVQVAAKTQAIDGTAFIRLIINGACVYEGHTVSGKYRYLWTPIFPVKKGDIIKVTLQTGTTDGQRFVYFYKS